MNTLTTLKGLLTAALFFASFAIIADVDSYADANSVTLSGHDAVAYFTENKAVEGSPEYTAVYEGVIYQFSSRKNRKLFNANPAKYAPAYGGFCAYGTALGKKLPVDGKAFEIVDGQLYVNKNLDVYEVWVEDKAENIATADLKWPEIKAIPASDL